jgi:polyisoprenoid-binding protein YceI
LTATVPASIPSTGTWKIDSIHSSASFKVTRFRVATFRGHFHDLTGTLEEGTLTGSVQTETIDLGTFPVFKEHMLGADWFDVENHKELSFSSTDLHAHGDQVHATGELTIKGVTRPVEISGTVRGPVAIPNRDGTSSDRLGLDLTTAVNRRDFGLTGEGAADDDVIIEVSLELVSQSLGGGAGGRAPPAPAS